MKAEDESPAEHSTPGVVRLALVLFCGSVVSLILYNVLPGFFREERGWTIWISIIEVVQSPAILRDFRNQILLASLLTLPVLVTASPFLTKVYLKSLLLWWLATLIAGISTFALWFFILSGDAWPNFGIRCLLAAPALNLAGLLSLRFAKRPVVQPRQS